MRRPLGRLDPGWATLVAAALALIGTLVTVLYQRGSSDDTKAKTVAVESTVGTTSGATTSPSTTPETTAASTSTTSTSVLPAAPTVSLLSTLPADQREAVNAVSVQLLAAANKLPLIVHDEFANNDYAWPQSSETFDGVKCSWTLAAGSFDTAINSANGPGFCRQGLSKIASDFVLTVEEHLRDESNSEIGLLFRVTDFGHYAVVYNPQTQTMWISVVGPDGESQILAPTFVGEINRSGSNQLTLLALGPSMLVSVNGALVVLISNETRFTAAGTILIREQLNEPNEDEVLSLTRFELRGG